VKKLQFIHTVNGDESKTAKKSEKTLLTILTSPECQCTAWSIVPLYNSLFRKYAANIDKRDF